MVSRKSPTPGGWSGAPLPLLVLFICLLTTFVTWRLLEESVDQKVEHLFIDKANGITTAMVQRLHDHEQVLRGGRGLFAASHEVTRDQWRRYVGALQLDQNHPGILGIGYSLWLKPEDVAANIRKIRAEGFPEYVIRPSGDRPVYTSIIYLEPFTWRNERAFGYDMYSEANRRAAMDKARNEGITTIASRIILVQETEKDKQIGLLMYMPVYRLGMPTDSVAQRQDALQGFVYSPIRMNDFVLGTLGKLPAILSFEIFDGDTPRQDRLMFSSLGSGSNSPPEQYRPLTLTRQVEVYGRTWTVVFRSLPPLGREFSRSGPFLILLSGILISGLLSFITFTLRNNRDKALALAQTMTRELRENEEKLRLILNTVGEAIYGIDTTGCCTFCNPACLRLLGFHSQDELLGKNMHDLIHHSHEDGSAFPVDTCSIFRAFTENTGCHVDGEALWRRDGSSFPAEYWSIPQYKDGVVVGAVVTFIDISERKRTEAALREQAEQLRQEVAQRRNAQVLLQDKQRELEELNVGLEVRVADEVRKNREKDQVLMQSDKMASLGQLAAGVAHEINNPMGYIASNLRTLAHYFAQLVAYDRLRQERAPTVAAEEQALLAHSRQSLEIEYILQDGTELITESLEGAERVTKIVSDLKSFSRVDAPEYEPMVLSACLESALNICFNELKYVATIRKEYGPEPEVLCHPGQLNQVFLNLLINAGQAIAPPGEIVLRSWSDDGFVYVSVSDSGVGIPADILERIFDPFFTTKDVGQGTGLGLSISYEIVKRHQGEILVQSMVGAGSTFTVKLPRAQEEHP